MNEYPTVKQVLDHHGNLRQQGFTAPEQIIITIALAVIVFFVLKLQTWPL